ncbi:hypothetical protein FB107DRAFT_224970, partial [Schizophyllum commune]
AKELVRVILIKGSARGTGVRRLKELHLNAGADDDFIRAVESGEQHIDPENFAFFFADHMPAKDAIKARYNREVIASVASYAYRVANADPTRYGYWPKRAYFRCAVEKVYRILLRWDWTQYRPGETQEALIQRIVDTDLEALAKARIRSSRHTKFDVRQRALTCIKAAAELLGNGPLEEFCDYAMEAIVMLGADGMSDEEDADVARPDGSIESVKRVSVLPWRTPALTDLFVAVDRLPQTEDLIFKVNGGARKRRIRDGRFLSTASHPIPQRLPAAFFDPQWLESHKHMAQMSRVDFASNYKLQELPEL